MNNIWGDYLGSEILKLSSQALISVLWSKKVWQEFVFKKIILVDTGDPLSAHVHTYTILIVDHILLTELYCIFGPQQKKPVREGKVGLSL